MAKSDPYKAEEQSHLFYNPGGKREFVQRTFLIREDGSFQATKRSTIGTVSVDQVLTLNPILAKDLRDFLNRWYPE